MTTRTKTPLFSRSERIVAFAVGMALILALLLLVLWRFVFVAIPPGHVGVLYSLLGGGTVLNRVIPEGLTAKLPWDRIYLFEVRTQRLPYQVVALSAEGMNVVVEGSTLFHPVYETVPDVLTTLGTDYRSRIVEPITLATIRQTITNYNSNELYSVDHDKLQAEILALVELHPLSKFINFDDVVITRIALPRNITNAIEDKLAQEQRAASYQFRLAAERQEAERLRIQAIGIRNFYSVVSQALNSTLLTWRGIEATVELSKSPNSKVVVIGSGEDQLPLILGSDISRVPEEPQPVPPIGGDGGQLPEWSDLPSIFKDSGLDVLNEGVNNGQSFVPPAKRDGASGDGARDDGERDDGARSDAGGRARGDSLDADELSRGIEETRPGSPSGTELSPGVIAPDDFERLKPADQ